MGALSGRQASYEFIDLRSQGVNIPFSELAETIKVKGVVGFLVGDVLTALMLILWVNMHDFSVLGLLRTKQGYILAVSAKPVEDGLAYQLLGSMLERVIEVRVPSFLACSFEHSMLILDPVKRSHIILRGKPIARTTIRHLEELISRLPMRGCQVARLDGQEGTMYLLVCDRRILGCVINENIAEPEAVMMFVEKAGELRVHVYAMPEEEG